MKKSRLASLLLLVLVVQVVSGQHPSSNDEQMMAEIEKKIIALTPTDADFKFEAPAAWGANRMQSASIVNTNEGESLQAAKLIIDGEPATTWVSAKYTPRPTITIDLKQETAFNRIVVFNRHTTSRGTGGGNNAARELVVRVSPTNDRKDLRLLKTFELSSPKAVCLKKGAGQICFFIDNTKPEVFEVAKTKARLIEATVQSAHWADGALEEWKSSCSMSEMMLFSDDSK